MTMRDTAALAACIVLSACSTTRFPEDEFPRSGTDLEMLATQQGIEREAKEFNGTFAIAAGTVLGGAVGGVAGLLVSTSGQMNKYQRAESVAPLRDHLGRYDLGTEFAERIQATDIAEELVSDVDPVVWNAPGPPEDRELKRKLIEINPRVQLSNDMQALVVKIEVEEVFPRNGHTIPKKGFSQSYRFVWPLKSKIELEDSQALEAWLEHSPEVLLALIDASMEHTVRMFETHLEQQTPVFEDTEELVRIQPSGHFLLWQEHGEVSWLARKSARGAFYAVPDHAIEANPDLGHETAR